jgi:transposase
LAGNRSDVTTLEEIVSGMETRYGKAQRTQRVPRVLDRGLISAENLEYWKPEGRRYSVGTPQAMRKRLERELLAEEGKQVQAGLEVRFCPTPEGDEVFLRCRSAQRSQKERARHDRFEKRIAEGLERIAESGRKRKQKPVVIAQRVGRWLGKNARASRLFQVQSEADPSGYARLTWKKSEAWRDWARLSEGCYRLRSNVTEWSAEELWRAYMQRTEAEAALRIHKSDLQLRPVWHQKQERVEAHILVCFLAYVLWKMLAQMCRQAGLGDEPRKVFDELARIMLVDIALPTRKGITIHKRCVGRPCEHQAILLQRLRLSLPSALEITHL